MGLATNWYDSNLLQGSLQISIPDDECTKEARKL